MKKKMKKNKNKKWKKHKKEKKFQFIILKDKKLRRNRKRVSKKDQKKIDDFYEHKIECVFFYFTSLCLMIVL